MAKARIQLVVNDRKRAMYERHHRYDVILDGEKFSELYFNMTGYVGYLPIPNAEAPNGFGKFDIGEKGISTFRREVAQLNRELRAAEVKRGSS